MSFKFGGQLVIQTHQSSKFAVFIYPKYLLHKTQFCFFLQTFNAIVIFFRTSSIQRLAVVAAFALAIRKLASLVRVESKAATYKFGMKSH